jgi:hypothetical protein
MEFAQPGDPLVTTSGKKVLANDGKDIDLSPHIPVARTIKSKIQRSVKDLPSDGQSQSVLNAVLLYHLLGVSKNEIAYTLGASITDVESIFKLPAFQETYEMLHTSIIDASSGSIHARLQRYATAAVDNLFELANAKPRKVKYIDDDGNEQVKDEYDVPPVVIMKSNDSILDRASIVGEQEFRQRNDEVGGGLEIVIHSGDENKTDIKVSLNGNRQR